MTRLDPVVLAKVKALIKKIIGKKKLGLIEVQAALLAENIKVSLPTIGKEAYRLGLTPPSGRRKGTKLSDATKARITGRPPGPGEQRSPYRAKARALRDQGLNNQQIADILMEEEAKAGRPRKFTREGVRQLLLPKTPSAEPSTPTPDESDQASTDDK